MNAVAENWRAELAREYESDALAALGYAEAAQSDARNWRERAAEMLRTAARLKGERS